MSYTFITRQHFIYFVMRTHALSDKSALLTIATVCQSGQCVIPTDDSPPWHNLLKTVKNNTHTNNSRARGLLYFWYEVSFFENKNDLLLSSTIQHNHISVSTEWNYISFNVNIVNRLTCKNTFWNTSQRQRVKDQKLKDAHMLNCFELGARQLNVIILTEFLRPPSVKLACTLKYNVHRMRCNAKGSAYRHVFDDSVARLRMWAIFIF